MLKLYLFFLLFVSCFLPGLAQATLKEDINNFFQFFYTGEETETQDQITPYQPQPIEIPSLYQIPDIPKLEDLTQVSKQLFETQTALESVESALQSLVLDGHDGHQKEGQLEQELFLLEGEQTKAEIQVQETQDKLDALEAEILKITKEKSISRSLYRIAKKEYETFMIQHYQRGNLFGGTRHLFFIKWLFSDENAADVLEERRQEENKEQIKRQKLQDLLALRQRYEGQERSILLHQTQKYALLKAQEYRLSTFETMRDHRSERLRDIRKSEIYQGFEVGALRKQQAQLSIELTHLQKARTQIHTYLKAQNLLSSAAATAPYRWPLKGQIEVTAGFKDAAYQARLGREHDGVDFWAEPDSDVLAISSGVVEKVHLGGFDYSFVLLAHEDGRYSTYGHLSQILVNEGDLVEPGDRLGLSGGEPGTLGAGPWTTGAHLHLSIFDHEGFHDPLKFLPKERE